MLFWSIVLAQDSPKVGVKQLQLAQSQLEEDQKDRKNQRSFVVRSLLQTLDVEIMVIMNAADSNLRAFQPKSSASHLEAEAMRDRDLKGESTYTRSLVRLDPYSDKHLRRPFDAHSHNGLANRRNKGSLHSAFVHPSSERFCTG